MAGNVDSAAEVAFTSFANGCMQAGNVNVAYKLLRTGKNIRNVSACNLWSYGVIKSIRNAECGLWREVFMVEITSKIAKFDAGMGCTVLSISLQQYS